MSPIAKESASSRSSRSPSASSSSSSAATPKGRPHNGKRFDREPVTADGRHRKHNLDLTSRDIMQDRSRSRTLTSGRSGQRGASRPSSGRWPSQGPGPNSSTTECWHGWKCSRRFCWFYHPDGRKIDQDGDRQRSRSRSSQPATRYRPSLRGGSQDRSSSESSAPSSPTPSDKKSPALRTPSPRKAEAATPKSAKSAKTLKSTKSEGGNAKPLDFRMFVLKHISDDEAPEVALARFERFKVELADRNLAQLKEHGKGLLFDMYNPMAMTRIQDLRVLVAREAACSFMRDWRSGGFDGIFLQSAAVNLSPLPNGSPCQIYGQLEAPHFGLDPEFGSLTLSDVPAQVSILDVLDKVWSLPGFVAFAITKPQQGKTVRQAKIRFETKAQSTAALAALLESRPWGEASALKATESVPALKLEGTLLSPEFAKQSRILKDLELARKVVARLDRLVGIPEEVTDFMNSCVGGQAATKALDMMVLYLRRVHHFCFFNGSWCEDVWDLHRRHGAAVLRQVRPDTEGADMESEAVQAHEKRIANFLATASLRKVDLSPSDSDGTKEQAVFNEIYDRNCSEPSQGRFKCGQCDKFFKGPEYVRKHLQKCHGEIFAEVQRRRHGESACKAFLADANRPVMPAGGQLACESR